MDIDMSTLAQKMLEWEQAKQRLDEIELWIKEAVMIVGKTQTVGNVRASYSAGRRSFDYKSAAEVHPMVSDATIKLFTKPGPVDWKGICEHAGIEDIPFTQSDPSVTVKLL